MLSTLSGASLIRPGSASVEALLGEVVRVSWNGSMQGSGRASVMHFGQSGFLQGEHGASLKKIEGKVLL